MSNSKSNPKKDDNYVSPNPRVYTSPNLPTDSSSDSRYSLAYISPPQPANTARSVLGTPTANTSQQGSGGVQTTRAYTPKRPTDTQADAMALAGHHVGKPLRQISDFLIPQGSGSLWDSEADTFALTTQGRGQTVSQIAAQLCRKGYEAPILPW